MTTAERAEIAAKVARECGMAAKIWNGDKEIRVYLRRTNASEMEAGYIRLWEADGKRRSKLCGTTYQGRGNRTAAMEAENVFDRYREAVRNAKK